jgi:phosphoribosyl 1,2-cyclic phosphodiesterase
MQVTFWGVRGSVPVPGADTLAFGGNTSCLEIRAGRALLIFDAGTGLRALGRKLLREAPIDAHLFFSHVHWDHIQGFPFFEPVFVAGNAVTLYGGSHVSRTLEQTLEGQMAHPHFPVHLHDLGATMRFVEIASDRIVTLDDGAGGQVEVRATRGNHPDGVWAFRVDHRGASAMYATDTEPDAAVDAELVRLARGVDLLVCDAQYTPEEYAGTVGHGGSKVGWGHSTFVAAAELARAAGAKRLLLFHHDPAQTDADVREKERRARELFPAADAAYEGLTVDLAREAQPTE